jgi:hypothetical protein
MGRRARESTESCFESVCFHVWRDQGTTPSWEPVAATQAGARDGTPEGELMEFGPG